MGLTFKENCPDTRNSKVPEIINILEKNRCKVDVFDPWVKHRDSSFDKKLNIKIRLKPKQYDAIIVAVAHKIFKNLKVSEYLKLCKKKHIIYDLKHILPKKYVDLRL